MERRLFLLSLLPLAGCRIINCDEGSECSGSRGGSSNNPTSPTPVPTPAPVANEIEFRVLGDVAFDFGVNGADVQYGSTQEGTAKTITTIPWFSSTKTFRDNLFLVLNASATGFGFLQVQIIVNGQLFREATASGFNPKVAVSGLFTK